MSELHAPAIYRRKAGRSGVGSEALMNAEPSAGFIAKEAVEVEAPLAFLVVGGFLIWLGIQALDPAWIVDNAKGPGFLRIAREALAWLSQYVSAPARGSIIIALGAVSLLLAVLGALYSTLWRDPQLIVDANGIERSSAEGKGRLAWKDIMTVRVIDDDLLVIGTGSAHLSVKTKEIDKSVPEIFSAIARYRPEVLPADKRGAASL